MGRGVVVVLAFAWLAGASGGLAQDVKRAPENIEYSSGMPHIVAKMTMGEGPDEVRYQYDFYTDDGLQRIKMDDSTSYARKPDRLWMKSDDWGETGASIEKELADRLDNFAGLVVQTFQAPEGGDPAQGGFVWKFIDEAKAGELTYYTYERTRERPREGGLYPRFVFKKYADDQDGQLLLSRVTGNLRGENGLIPFTIDFDYLVPLPADVKIEYGKDPAPKDGGASESKTER